MPDTRQALAASSIQTRQLCRRLRRRRPEGKGHEGATCQASDADAEARAAGHRPGQRTRLRWMERCVADGEEGVPGRGSPSWVTACVPVPAYPHSALV